MKNEKRIGFGTGEFTAWAPNSSINPPGGLVKNNIPFLRNHCFYHISTQRPLGLDGKNKKEIVFDTVGLVTGLGHNTATTRNQAAPPHSPLSVDITDYSSTDNKWVYIREKEGKKRREGGFQQS